MPKLNTAQREKVRRTALEFHVRGLGPADMVVFLKEKGGIELSTRQLARYTSEVKEELKRNSRTDREEEIGRALSRLDGLYRKLEQNDPRGALQVEKQRQELLGLITHHHEHSGKSVEDWLDRVEKEDKDKAKAEGKKKDVPVAANS